MADEDGFSDLPAKCLSKMADIVEIILRFAPGRCLESAAGVCTLWRDTVERIRRSRRDCVTFIQPIPLNADKLRNIYHNKPCFDFTQSLSSVATEPQAALLFTCVVSASASVPRYMNDFKKYLNINESHLPNQCVLVGCATSGIYHLGNNQQQCLGENTSLTEKNGSLNAMVLLPRALGVHVCGFHLPLRDKYKSISGLDCFLPVMDLPVKLVIVLAHPLSLGKLANFAVKVKKKYGRNTVIAGCYSDCVLFHKSTVTFREIVGLVFAGNLNSASIVISGSNQSEVLENLHQGLMRLKAAKISSENAMAIMFRSPAHQCIHGNMNCKVFQHHFPNVPILVVDGTAVYGCDTVELERTENEPGGRDFLHTQSSVLCMYSLALTK